MVEGSMGSTGAGRGVNWGSVSGSAANKPRTFPARWRISKFLLTAWLLLFESYLNSRFANNRSGLAESSGLLLSVRQPAQRYFVGHRGEHRHVEVSLDLIGRRHRGVDLFVQECRAQSH